MADSKKPILGWVVAVLVFACVLGSVLYLGKNPWLIHTNNWASGELTKEVMPLFMLERALRQYIQANAGQTPSSIEELKAMLDEEVLARDPKRDNLERAVLLRNVTLPSGVTCKWLLVLLVPKGGMFGPFQEEMFFVLSDETQGGVGCEQAERMLGDEIVRAARKRDEEVRARNEQSLIERDR